MTSQPIALVANRRAGRGRVARELPRLLDLLDRRGIHAWVLETEEAGDATRLTRSAVESGAHCVVAVGGDGTVNEVVNGLLDDRGRSLGARLGVVAAGSGCDFARSFHLPSHVDSNLRGVVGAAIPLDVGRIECTGLDGEALTRYFVNVAEAGMAAETVRRAERLPRFLGRTRYMVAFWPALVRYRPTMLTVTAGGETHRVMAHNALVANARFFGGGMKVSPTSDPSDGVAEVQINVGPKRQALTLIPRMFRGTHLPDARIVEMSGSTISIDSDKPVLIEADGELVGRTPGVITIVPRALELVG